MLDAQRLLEDADLSDEVRNRLREATARDLEHRGLRSGPTQVLVALSLVPSGVDEQHPVAYWGFLLVISALVALRFVSVALIRKSALPVGRARMAWFAVPWFLSALVFGVFCALVVVWRPHQWESIVMCVSTVLGAISTVVYFSAYGRATFLYALLITAPAALTSFWVLGLQGIGLVIALLYVIFLVLILPMLVRLHNDHWSGLVGRALLEDRARKLQEQSQQKSAFLAYMSHELRTPMNGIIGMARNLQSTPLLPDQRRGLTAVLTSAEGLLSMLNDMLDAAKIEAGRLELNEQPCSLRTLLRSATDLFSGQASSQGVLLNVELQEPFVDLASCDGARIRQVVQNLVGNAVKFTTRGSVTLRAATRDEGQGLRLFVDVIDTGEGFAPEQAERLFRRFATLGPRSDGTGLGLFLSRELVERMGGRLSAHSDGVGQGARFSFSLPLRSHTPSPQELGPMHVLLADDDALSLRVARAMLESLGCSVDTATSGSSALALAHERRYDALVLDCWMPALSGIEVASAVRSRQLPIIGVSANADEHRAEGLAAGMSVVLGKPLSPEALRDALVRARAAVVGPATLAS